MLLQAGITTAFILLGGGFRSLINFTVVASWAFFFLTVCLSASACVLRLNCPKVLGLVILRIKEPTLHRYGPFTWNEIIDHAGYVDRIRHGSQHP